MQITGKYGKAYGIKAKYIRIRIGGFFSNPGEKAALYKTGKDRPKKLVEQATNYQRDNIQRLTKRNTKKT